VPGPYFDEVLELEQLVQRVEEATCPLLGLDGEVGAGQVADEE
jgi:hypothetical protein